MVRRVAISAQIQRKLNVVDLQTFVPKAAVLEPGNDEVFRIHSHLSELLGNLDEAIKLEEQAIALNPLHANSHLVFSPLVPAPGFIEHAIGFAYAGRVAQKNFEFRTPALALLRLYLLEEAFGTRPGKSDMPMASV
jgi:hypothetical protein